jgi:hypothetical protein
MSDFDNRPLLDEIASADGWFHAKKTKAIWVRVLDADETIGTLEGPVDAKAGDGLCRGEAGELWPQSLKSIRERYVVTDETDGPWQRYQPHPDNQGVLAAQVDRAFQVQSPWGLLSGQPGDYVVKSFADKETASPEDVWIVSAELFAATYERVT